MNRRSTVLLIDNYDSFTFNIYQYLSELGATCKVVRNDEIDIEKMRKMKLAGIVISPGPGNPDSAGVSLEAISVFAGKLPILGVCLGHQAIAQAFGGKVIRAQRLFHGKTSEIHHNKRGIYQGVENPFLATRYHSLVVERKSLPRCFEVTSETKEGVIMGLKHRKFNLVGVQFHPESIMTTQGKTLLMNFLEGKK